MKVLTIIESAVLRVALTYRVVQLVVALLGKVKLVRP